MNRSNISETARAQFGGANGGAAFYGWIVALGIGTLATAVVSAISGGLYAGSGATATDLSQNAASIGVGSAVALLVILGLSYFAGGYVAGRMSRFDGAAQGRATWYVGLAITIVVALVAAVAGASFNVLQQISLPGIPVSLNDLTTGSIITLVLALAVSYLAATSGGRLGVGYHRKVDRAAVRDAEAMNSGYSARSLPTFGETVDSVDDTSHVSARRDGVRVPRDRTRR